MKQKVICGISALISFVPAYGAKGTSNHGTRDKVHYGVQYSLASWYGGRDQGHLMACGIPFSTL